jgi:hypothetical protein
VSWKAVDWATDSAVGSPILKLILILLANKADEQFSCFPSIRTLMAESGAGRSTVLRALKTLESDGLIIRRAQFHDSGAQRSSRYYLNHPDAPQLGPGPNSTLPRSDLGRGGFRRETGRVPLRHPTGEPETDPFNPSLEPPSEPSPNRTEFVFRKLPAPWTVGRKDRTILAPAIEEALAAGWTVDNLALHLAQNPTAVRYPARVLAARLADLPPPHASSDVDLATRLPWCGECEDERSRTVTIIRSDGTDSAAFCPRCSPQAQQSKH